jgi:hypothetical protein
MKKTISPHPPPSLLETGLYPICGDNARKQRHKPVAGCITRNSLLKYTLIDLLDESTLRKRYMPKYFEKKKGEHEYCARKQIFEIPQMR